MSKSKLLIYLIILIVGLLIVSFFIPKETKPSSDTRIILEHTYQTYIAPGQPGDYCFEQSNPTPTNYLEDSTLEKAWDLNYEPHDSCTEEALESERDSLFFSLLKDIGILNKKWDDW
ncbi:hypothetical protein [Virgibacillus kimchii]